MRDQPKHRHRGTTKGITSANDSPAGKFFRRMMLAQGTYQMESTGEQMKARLDLAGVEGRRLGRPQALTRNLILVR